ncbi:HTH-type transcriptional regulator RamB [Sulfitobacter indolifex]|uniref:Transcriptional regulator, putative n=1 Tax=Sulfitobacter indolifex HEL-45 TaxID=391624 RepID=A0ABM9X482_9RHOB|nr:helix-turn-helix transcriptional regulator [Sulfitobacter indolifex]EDQ04224.1 transcriptional regulator, putative [Sulfitobacter indolifex HEL-45]UOA19076.1 HTH-type transcriptional regulator RamB [Sulfitobacter indolifex]
MREGLTGSRIRERRVMAGLKQAELAQQSGISASYLNLIEHNRRRIGGKLLLNIAQALGVEPQALTEGAEAALIAALREAAEDAGLAGPESDRADEFAGRFPGWAKVLATSQRRIDALEQTVEALSDRLAHDPQLATSMHELLSTAAAIRSTAAILAETDSLQPEWRDRFHANIHEDSRRLSDSAQALVTYFDNAAETREVAHSPQAEVEAFLAAHDYRFEPLEQARAPEIAIAELVEQAEALKTKAARHIATGVLQQIARDAAALPLDRLESAVAERGHDPALLAQTLEQPVGRVLRRLASLPDLGAGLVVCDRSGSVTFAKSIDGFTVPRFGACCPLWPLFAVQGQPGLVVKSRVMQMGRGQAEFEAIATCEVQAAAAYNTPPLSQSVMLLLPVPSGAAPAQPVGATCRICPVEGCRARREPSILRDGI